MSSDEQFPLQKSDADWRRELTPEAYQVLREHGTERAAACSRAALKCTARAAAVTWVTCSRTGLSPPVSATA